MAAKRAAGRTPCNPWDMRFPLCVGRMWDGTMFSSVCALPSPASAEGMLPFVVRLVIRPQSGPSPGAQPVSVYSGVISITQGGLPESAGAIRRLDVDPSQSAYEVYGATFYGPGARKSNQPPSLASDIPLCTYSAPEVGVRCSRHLPRDGDHSGCRQTLSSSRVQHVFAVPEAELRELAKGDAAAAD
jgi:hypothetical protein